MTFLRLKGGGASLKSSIKKFVLWALVMDGSRALIFATPRGKSELVLKKTFFNENLTSHDPGSDRSGRDFDSFSSARHAYEPRTPWDVKEKNLFVQEISKFLKKKTDLHHFDQLILIAPSKILGELRHTLSGEVARKVIKEIDKDLTHLTEKEMIETLEPYCFPLLQMISAFSSHGSGC
jgi:protein required for attachment to host cells